MPTSLDTHFRQSSQDFDGRADSPAGISWRELEGNTARDGQLNLCTRSCPARYLEQPADSRGSFPHAGQAPVTFTSCFEHLRIDATSVVANPHAQVIIRVFEFELDAPSSRMTKRVDQCLSANSVNLLLNGRAERLLRADDTNAKVDAGLDCEFLLNLGQSQN